MSFIFFLFSSVLFWKEKKEKNIKKSNNNMGIRGAMCIMISFPEPANFSRRMFDENEGSGKDWF